MVAYYRPGDTATSFYLIVGEQAQYGLTHNNRQVDLVIKQDLFVNIECNSSASIVLIRVKISFDCHLTER